jgi:hypothetical protein
MANEEHLKILKSGVEKWNKWREENRLVRPILRKASLRHATLRDINFRETDLSEAELVDANLFGVNFGGAILNGSDLRGANLDGAHFLLANLIGVELAGSNVTFCSFSSVSLVGIKGLEAVQHFGPSEISVSTLEKTAADLSQNPASRLAIEGFLERSGVPNEYMDLFRSRIGQPIQFYSVFISYSTKDQDFANRLYADMRQRNIRVWLATEDLKIGDKFRTRINEAIRVHDKLLVVLSEHSVKSAWVEDEVENAFERERRDNTTMLFPIRLDEAVMHDTAAWADSIRRTRHIGDFTKWKDHDEYQKALARLIRDLQSDDKTKAPNQSSPSS